MLFMTQCIFAGKKRLSNSEGIELDMAISYLSRYVILNEIVNCLGNVRVAVSSTYFEIFIAAAACLWVQFYLKKKSSM